MTFRRAELLFLPVLLLLGGCSVTLPPKRPLLEREGYPVVPLREPAPGEYLLQLVYPLLEPGDSLVYIAPTDSVFLLGNVSDPHGLLVVGGEPVEIHPDGGWLAWVGFEERIAPGTGLLPGDRAAGKVTIRYTPGSQEKRETFTRTIWFVYPTEHRDTVEPPVYPFAARLVVRDDVSAKIRCGWPGTYDLFPPAGTVLWTDGYRSTGRTFFRVPLGRGETGWIEDEQVLVDSTGPPPVKSIIYTVHADVDGRDTRIRVPLNGDPAPFRVEQVSDGVLELTVYGAVSWTDIIEQPLGSPVIEELRWRQVDAETWRLRAFLRPGSLWGWDAGFTRYGDLLWTVRGAPEIGNHPLKGLRVVLDPGHGGENLGTVSGTNIPEKEVTLPLAFTVRDELASAGAEVLLTRTADVGLGLVERVEFARNVASDIVISLHYNALPQGVNPFEHHGTSVLYYHRHSLNAAEILLHEINRAIGWEGDGLKYQDLAVPRLSACPSVLIETAYLLHPEEAVLAGDAGFREAVAGGIRRGLEKWLCEVRGRVHRDNPGRRDDE